MESSFAMALTDQTSQFVPGLMDERGRELQAMAALCRVFLDDRALVALADNVPLDAKLPKYIMLH